MFVFKQCGPERVDCTAPYNIILDKEYDVREFVDTVLNNREKEWGYIGMYKESGSFENRVFGSPNCEYKWGKLLSFLPDDILDKKVLSVSADGGWSRMDYILKIEE